MFKGEYSHSVDAKGRIIMPAKFREILGDMFVVTKGLDGCLFVYPNDEWENIENKFREIPLTTKDARKFSRFSLRELLTVKWTSRAEFWSLLC